MTTWVVGATGFVGGALMARLVREHREVIPVSRGAEAVLGQKAFPSWALGSLLQKGDVVVYVAGRAHVQGGKGEDEAEAFLRANCACPLAAARLAESRGAKRFVFVSSVKVNGEKTEGIPFSEVDRARPVDDYGRSKAEGEEALRLHAVHSRMELVIVRPPLVYGPGVRANFASMMRALRKGIPLPLKSVSNRRSLIYVENLVDLLMLCSEHPAAAGQVVMASDGRDVSTPELLRMLGSAMGTPARLWSCPVPVLKAGATLVGRRLMAERLCDSLQVSSDFARHKLMWRPPFTVEEGVTTTAEWFVGQN